MTRANLMLIGHGHHDHMSDAASVGIQDRRHHRRRTGDDGKAAAQSVDPKKVRTVAGREGETLEFGAFKVEPILGRHGDPPKTLGRRLRRGVARDCAEADRGTARGIRTIRARGTQDTRVATEGTIAYLIILDNGFRIMYRDSGGRVTDFEKSAMERTGRVDVALVAVSASYLNTVTVPQALEHVRTYKPDVYFPAHHDARLQQPLARDQAAVPGGEGREPNIVTVSKGYREPTVSTPSTTSAATSRWGNGPAPG